MKHLLYMLLAACLFTGCDIDRLPTTSMPAEDVNSDPEGTLQALMNGTYDQLKDWSDVMHRCGEYAGDNMMIRGSSTDAFYEFISYSRTPNNGRLNTFWNNSYKAIAQSSNIIKMIPEGTDAEKDNTLGQCYFIRGMMYFYMCRAFGRPYYQSPETNLGVPIVNGTPENILGELHLPDRATVKETYVQAIADLTKAAELLTINDSPIFASQGAAWALLSRVYLYMSGTYDTPNSEYAKLAAEYADKVINSGQYRLLDRENYMKYNTFTPEQNTETIFAIKRVASEYSGYDHYYGIGGMYAVIGGMGWGEMYASAKHIEMLDETGHNDWANNNIVDARAAFIDPQYEDSGEQVFRFIKNIYNSAGTQTGYAYVQAGIVSQQGSTVVCKEGEVSFTLKAVDAEQGIYSVDYTDGKTYRGVLDKKMKLNRVYPMFYIYKCSREGEESHLHSPVITSLDEVYLNKAEAEAKLGNYAAALTALNIIRERAIPGAGYASLSRENAETRIDKERQLELAFRAERSYDVYRNGRALTRHYPGPHNAMEEIPATDYRVTYYIPQDAINSYSGTLTQNPTSN